LAALCLYTGGDPDVSWSAEIMDGRACMGRALLCVNISIAVYPRPPDLPPRSGPPHGNAAPSYLRQSGTQGVCMVSHKRVMAPLLFSSI